VSEEKGKYEVFYKKTMETMDRREEIIVSTESQTDTGAWENFVKLKKEMKVDV